MHRIQFAGEFRVQYSTFAHRQILIYDGGARYAGERPAQRIPGKRSQQKNPYQTRLDAGVS